MLSCFGRRFPFSSIASFSWLVSEAVNKAVKFKAALLAFKSNIFYHPNPSTRGFTADLPSVLFTAAISWARSPWPSQVESRDLKDLLEQRTRMQQISQALHHEAYWGRTQSEGKTKSSHNDSTHSEAHSSLGLSGLDCTVLHPQRLLVTRGDLERYFWVTGQGRKPRPGLGSLPWLAPLWAPFTRTPRGRPSVL